QFLRRFISFKGCNSTEAHLVVDQGLLRLTPVLFFHFSISKTTIHSSSLRATISSWLITTTVCYTINTRHYFYFFCV
ncbi:Bgt-20995, partial [Blumeria graminis f. sp. tritici]